MAHNVTHPNLWLHYPARMGRAQEATKRSMQQAAVSRMMLHGHWGVQEKDIGHKSKVHGS